MPRQALPLTIQVAHDFIGFLLSRGDMGSALSIAICWGALLRSQEALDLKIADLALPGDHRLSDCGPEVAGVLIKVAKTG